MMFLVIRAYVLLVRFDMLLVRRNFTLLYDKVRSTPRLDRPCDARTTEQICSAVDLASIWYWKHVLCLQRSAVTACLLKRYGVSAEMVIGAQQMPFKAHAWLKSRAESSTTTRTRTKSTRSWTVAESAVKTKREVLVGMQFGHWIFGTLQVNGRLTNVGQQPENVPPCAKVLSSCNVSLVYEGLAPIQVKSTQEPYGDVLLLWNGRLDNGPDLLRQLGGKTSSQTPDEEIVAACYGRWQTRAFPKLIGDWSLTVWNPAAQSLILAKDLVGLRPLFYTVTPSELKWSSALEPLVENSSSSLNLDFEYLAGWLSFFPAPHLTPYRGILAVPPSSFLCFEGGRSRVRQHWQFDPGKQIRYADAFDYEEHFRAIFTNAVRRRLRSAKPLLAELSGGMDSSSIVCVSDALMRHEMDLAPRLDTLSFYDDAEPNWNEQPYFAKVEEKRGRTGRHIKIESENDLIALLEDDAPALTPAQCGKNSSRNQQVEELVKACGYAEILSGTGGDEFMGGVPTPIPELANLIAALRLPALCRQLKLWALSQRLPWMQLLGETLRSFAPQFLFGPAPAYRPAPWLMPRFTRLHRAALAGYDRRLTFFGPRPSFQENLSTLKALQRQIACFTESSSRGCERRYPYLDRDLLEFIFAVPREQLVEPGRRRVLMRRSLAGIVPDEILTRKRKAYVNRGPRVAIANRWTELLPFADNMIAESLGIASSRRFLQSLEDVRLGREIPLVPLIRTLTLERWLRNLAGKAVLRPTELKDVGIGRAARTQASSNCVDEKVSAG
ncbi:MAG TPA: lasso peptide biosynthesis B2 protein [Candidatus Acidoferrum sp.]|nr:lasso peptide biosynthesis B2 protein [Candidatus Acidoferrum sp.]